MRRVDSGSVCSPRLVELTMSAKRTVTVFRTSPGAGEAPASGVAQFRQNRARSGFSSPQLGHRIMRRSVRGAENQEARRDAGLLPGRLGWLVARALSREAVAAVDRLGAGRAERHLSLAAAVRACRAEHLARSAIVTAAHVSTVRVATVARLASRRLADGAAGGAATRLAELAICEELLLTRGEREFLATVGAGQRLIGHG